MDPETWRWWTLLRATSVLNLLLLGWTAATVPLDGPNRAVQLTCATIYVLVCGFRSFWPRVDLERTVLVDHPLSSIALGRTAATVAELVFTLQCALFVHGLGAHAVAWSLVPLIAVAQGCCWLGVLTQNHLWHAAEEALWAVMMAMLAVVFISAAPGAAPAAALILGVVGCFAGAFVMAGVDIPMYVARWRSESAAGRRYLTVRAGFADALHRRVPTGAWAVWRREVPWMTPYFSAAVWLSLGMVWL